MLIGLSISQFTIVEQLDIDFATGMTAITGETGAGKSIALDALSLALGERADSQQIRHGAEKADIRAIFRIDTLANVKHWLADNDLDTEDDCILRRVITRDGRSKAYINGTPVNLQTLKTVGAMLVDIHSQHAHHQLLQRDYHQQLLDAYAGNIEACKLASTYFNDWQHTLKQIRQLEKATAEADTRKAYLEFQLDEFQQLQLQAGEFEQLEREHQQLANAESLQAACEQTLAICRDNDHATVLTQLQHCQQLLSPLLAHSSHLREANELLGSATINIQEACHSLRNQLNQGLQPGNLATIEQRLGNILDLARKHRCKPAELPNLQMALSEELHSLNHQDERIAALQQQAQQQQRTYEQQAQQLSQSRQTAAKKLALDIKAQLSALGMSNCTFSAELNTDSQHPKASGFDNIEFQVSTNPGQPAQGLHKIASGGELSRISLAIQVITAKTSTIPTLVFDEVDVGIGGATAEVVGRLLRKLSESAQILCVTHQPQVASQAQQHYFVAKKQLSDNTVTTVTTLQKEDRVKEIARMLGGVEMTNTTLKHAKEMLKA